MDNQFDLPLFAGALAIDFLSTDAEELAQDTFVAFLSGIERFQTRSQLKTYLFGFPLA